ncbi:unnamed protein product [Gadus morhua 'NCC']
MNERCTGSAVQDLQGFFVHMRRSAGPSLSAREQWLQASLRGSFNVPAAAAAAATTAALDAAGRRWSEAQMTHRDAWRVPTGEAN